MNKPWIQIAIDVREIGEARKLARTAVEAGADWIEAGTPLITFESVRAIGALVQVCQGRPVVADFKAQDGVGKYFLEAGRQGAKIATVLGAVPDGSIQAAVNVRQESGVEVVVDLLGVKNLAQRAREVEALGADYLMLHQGFDEARADPSKHVLDGLEELVKAVEIPVGVGVFTLEEAIEAVQMGASFVVQGEPLLSAPDLPSRLADFVQRVKAA